MSNPNEPNQPRPHIDPRVGLMAVAVEHLACLFEIGPVDRPLAKRMAISALHAYEPETRADFVNAARTIAFSMAALALLGKAASQDITFPEQMRAYSRANALNRSANQSERTMMQRRRGQRTNPPAEQPEQRPEPPDQQTGDAEMEIEISRIMAEYLATCPPPAAKPAPPATEKTATPQPQAATPASAIRYSLPMPQAADPATASFKEALLRQSAIYRAVDRNGASA